MIELVKGDSDRIKIVVKDMTTKEVKPLTGLSGKLVIKKYNGSVELVDIPHSEADSDLAAGVLIFLLTEVHSNSLEPGTYKLRVRVYGDGIRKTVFKDDIKIEI